MKLKRTKMVAFKTLDISQGSVATQLRCGGIFYDNIITIFFWFWQWNNFENRLIFDKVEAYENGASFLGHSVGHQVKWIQAGYTV